MLIFQRVAQGAGLSIGFAEMATSLVGIATKGCPCARADAAQHSTTSVVTLTLDKHFLNWSILLHIDQFAHSSKRFPRFSVGHSSPFYIDFESIVQLRLIRLERILAPRSARNARNA
jgi:hypothetical protein